MNMSLLNDFLSIGSGLFLTLPLLLGGISIGLFLGAALAILRYRGWMVPAIATYVSLVRGTPVILQLSFFYFVLPHVLGIKPSLLLTGILTLGLNSAAYITEIFRAGIASIPQGQFEAALSLQIPSLFMWRDILLPQVFRNVFPALINELISLLKETALISTVGGMDIMRRAQSIAAEQFTYFGPLCIAGAYYYALVLLIEYLGKKAEARMTYAQHH